MGRRNKRGSKNKSKRKSKHQKNRNEVAKVEEETIGKELVVYGYDFDKEIEGSSCSTSKSSSRARRPPSGRARRPPNGRYSNHYYHDDDDSEEEDDDDYDEGDIMAGFLHHIFFHAFENMIFDRIFRQMHRR